MDYYDEEFYWRLALPLVDCLWSWLVLLLLNKRVDIIFYVERIFMYSSAFDLRTGCDKEQGQELDH
jgi:hypothetical protein